MSKSTLQATLLRLNDPRKIVLLLNLLFLVLALSGCGDNIPACPSASSGGSCS
jgi:hypothetical protein